MRSSSTAELRDAERHRVRPQESGSRRSSDKNATMTATPGIDLSAWVGEHLCQASTGLLRNMVKTFAEEMISAEANAAYGTVVDAD